MNHPDMFFPKRHRKTKRNINNQNAEMKKQTFDGSFNLPDFHPAAYKELNLIYILHIWGEMLETHLSPSVTAKKQPEGLSAFSLQ